MMMWVRDDQQGFFTHALVSVNDQLDWRIGLLSIIVPGFVYFYNLHNSTVIRLNKKLQFKNSFLFSVC